MELWKTKWREASYNKLDMRLLSRDNHEEVGGILEGKKLDEQALIQKVKQKFPEQQKLPRFESKGIFFKKSNGNS
jgi:hypothetical protein